MCLFCYDVSTTWIKVFKMQVFVQAVINTKTYNMLMSHLMCTAYEVDVTQFQSNKQAKLHKTSVHITALSINKFCAPGPVPNLIYY